MVFDLDRVRVHPRQQAKLGPTPTRFCEAWLVALVHLGVKTDQAGEVVARAKAKRLEYDRYDEIKRVVPRQDLVDIRKDVSRSPAAGLISFRGSIRLRHVI